MSKNSIQLLIIFIFLIIGIWLILPNNPGIHIGSYNKNIQTQLGLDLVGGIQVLLEADLPPDTVIDPEAMRTAVEIVENRVNGLGVNEAVVQLAGANRINVELPGATNREEALDTVKQTGLLEFVDFGNISTEELVLLQDSVIQTDFASSLQSDVENPTIPSPTDTITTGAVITPTSGPLDKIYHTVMTGAVLKTVAVRTNEVGDPEIMFTLTSDGAKLFAEHTSTHIGQVMAIVLDKTVISTPVINTAIDKGEGVITGNFTIESANAFAVQLRYGSLPIPLKVVESRTVGPTLGQDSLQKSLTAGLIGFSIVVLFMILYYRLPGFVAVLSIILYAIMAFAVFRFIPVTITLPGVAGFLLSTGSALDANILIFERFKEELRSGRKLMNALDLGWKRAWPSIRDSNIATLITCGILFWFGSAFGATIVKGFSLTLALGVAISLFTAIVVTRTLLSSILSVIKTNDYSKWFGI